MQRAASLGQQGAAAGQVETVERVAGVGVTASGRHELGLTKLAEMVGHQILCHADRRGQFVHWLVAGGERAKQSPP